MSDEQIGKVVRFFQSGGHLRMRSHGYVDAFATLREDGGTWLIKSQVWAEVPLRDYRFHDLDFYRSVPAEDLS